MLKHELLNELAELKSKRTLKRELFDLPVIVDHLYENYNLTKIGNNTFIPLTISQFLLDRIPEEYRTELLTEILARLQEDLRNYLSQSHYDPQRRVYVVSGSY